MPTIEDFSQIPALYVQNKDISYDFEMGSLLFQSGNFRKSLPHLKKAMSIFLEQKNFPSYFDCYGMMIQILNELGEKEILKILQQEVEEICKIYKISNTPRALVYSAYYNIYTERDFDKAKKELNEALKMAFDAYDKYKKTDNHLEQIVVRFEIIKCLFVYSTYYFETEDYENCIKELKNLKILLEDYFKLKLKIELECSKTDNVQDLKDYHDILKILKENTESIQRIQLAFKYIEAIIEIKYRKAYEQAEKLLWEIYEKANKTNNTFFVPYVLYSMAINYINLKNKKQAQMLFNLAEKHINEDRKALMLYMENFKQEGYMDQIEETENYDLVFDLKNHIVMEKEKGCIDLKNQFILMDLLKLFLLNPGVSYSKEQIVKEIWKQNYLPETHDNKIYVTIKRLREVIEINSCKPRYICRNNIGYHFSKQARILVKQEEVSNV